MFETPSFTVLGGCLTIMMYNVFGVSFWGVGGGVLGGCFQINVGVLGGDLSAVRHSFSRGGGGVRGGMLSN